MGTALIDYYLHPNQHIGSIERHHVPRTGDEIVLFPREGKLAQMYRVVRVVWSDDLTPRAAQLGSNRQAVDVFLEKV